MVMLVVVGRDPLLMTDVNVVMDGSVELDDVVDESGVEEIETALDVDVSGGP